MTAVAEPELHDLPSFGDEPRPVHELLIDVMCAIQSIGKDEQFVNEKTGRTVYNFRGVDAVMQAVGPLLRKFRILPVPEVTKVEQRESTTKTGSVMRETLVHVTYHLRGPVDVLDVQVVGEAADYGDKSVSKATSVAYRIMWLQLLCIPTGDPDPDLLNYERGIGQAVDRAGGGAAEREANQPSRETLLETVNTTSTELRTLLGAGEYEWLEWLAKVCQKDFGVNIIKVRTDDGPVEEIDLAKLRTNQLAILWNRLNGKLKEEKRNRAAEAVMSDV